MSAERPSQPDLRPPILLPGTDEDMEDQPTRYMPAAGQKNAFPIGMVTQALERGGVGPLEDTSELPAQAVLDISQFPDPDFEGHVSDPADAPTQLLRSYKPGNDPGRTNGAS